MELSTADPVPTSVQFQLAALLSNSAGGEICRCFFSPHKQMHQAKPSQAADGRQCQMYEKKNVLFRPKLCIWERRAFSKVFKQSDCFAFFGKTVHLLCFAFTLELNHLYPLGTGTKLFRFVTFRIIEIHKHNCLNYNSSKSTNLNY